MYRSNPPLYVLLVRTLMALAVVVVLLVVLALVFNEKILTFAVNHFTVCKMTYSDWKKDLQGGNVIKDLRLDFPKYKFYVTSTTAKIDLDIVRSFHEKRFIWKCRFKNVRFYSGKSVSDKISNDNIFSVPFDPRWEYRFMDFITIASPHMVRMDDFDAFSDDVRIRGVGEMNVRTNDLKVDVNLAFSPKVSERLMGDFREQILTKGEDGWYSTDICLKGNNKTMAYNLKSDFIEVNIKSK